MHFLIRKGGSIVLITITGTIILGIFLLIHRTGGSEARGESQRSSEQGELPTDFNHDATSFPLLGAHKELKCSQCHLGGKYKSVPTTCENCHNDQIAYGKPKQHVMTTQSCNVCHSLSSWSPAIFKHDLATVTGQCSTCHNGQKAASKPQNHIVTTAQCDTCHRTTGWIPAVFTNHDNPKLIGAHSPLDCKACHTQSIPSVFYRDGTQYGFCANCHTRDYKFPGPGDHKNNPVTKQPYASMAESLQANAMCANCHRHADYRQF